MIRSTALHGHWRAGLVALFLAAPASAAHDGAYTGTRLLEDFAVCDSKPAGYECGRAANYVKGFAKRLLQGHIGDPRHPQICLSSDIGVAELTDLVRNYLEVHPERSEELAVWLVRDAMIQRFPCRQ